MKPVKRLRLTCFSKKLFANLRQMSSALIERCPEDVMRFECGWCFNSAKYMRYALFSCGTYDDAAVRPTVFRV